MAASSLLLYILQSMKRCFFIFFSLIVFFNSFAWGQEDGMTPSKSFIPDKKIHDFGMIQEKNGKVKHTFLFKNSGNRPVAISNVSAWCGCTEVDYAKKPIQVGETAKVTVTFNPSHRSGKFSKEVVVLTDNGKSYTRVWVKGEVIPFLHPVTEDYPYAYGEGLYMSHKVVMFPPLKKGESFSFQLRVANDTDKPMTVEFRRQPNNLILNMPRKLKLKAKERVSIPLVYQAPKTYGYKRYITVYPSVNGKPVKAFKVFWTE